MTRTLRDALVLALLLGASGFFIGKILASREPVSLPVSGATVHEAGDVEAFALPDVRPVHPEQLTAAVERPLFVKARRPPTAPPPAPSELNATLAGVMSAGGEKMAIVIIAGSGRAVHLRERDQIEGWQVIRIDDQAVVLEKNGRTERLDLTFTGTSASQAEGPSPEQSQATQQTRGATGGFFVTEECGLTQCQGGGRQQR